MNNIIELSMDEMRKLVTIFMAPDSLNYSDFELSKQKGKYIFKFLPRIKNNNQI